ncbi:putative transcriptional regulator, CopG family [Sulfolobus islandicus Y.G.57.14]|jgi:CopG family nickel-responsive transcriptional regulator|uniref:Putative nickel-responsive regulator n=10 Tax=Saccharolobus islandicus TaxID=43080 RepID=NIKR_SACI1|nr:CopG family ribbon-helix-helix protein [Sulfolobus islandicus]C3MQC7.1 RecName: Full=Putative nickel-responsive regulator [Sulfolobus islandicus L.S.2.15]C3MW06.1 RecName: Full=Putative nickel-responsive regulator [Sulfolobus islandicus M.14.25]C3N649.1 RecName: Full=Putative nickel-responsive regulator [Sulfolobus islandicus M.16.27]C3NEK4.1 RecName: Full=Putative nickel-responsive regulator [Sulfolobus islandicus Y.G.57.14]C3NH39.1 RecName: Full=Putative nickel-responsive regulator [Sulfo
MSAEKISISLPKELYRELEDFITRKGIPDRSKIFQIALRNYLDENREGTEIIYGIINLVYDHEEASEALTEIQHEYKDNIISTLHLHVNERLCIEAIAVKGEKSKLVELNNRLGQIRGILKARLLISFPYEKT